MKNLWSFTLFTTLSCAMLLPAAQAKEVLVAISPYQQDAILHIKQLIRQLPSLKPDTAVSIIDGFNLNKIAQFNIPAGQLSPRAIVKRNRKAIGSLVRFSKSSSSAQLDVSTTINVIRLPQLLHYIGENYVLDSSNELDVIILAAPLYDDPAEMKVSMAGAYIPSDGHIHASRASSPYGTKETVTLLSHLRVHMGFNDESDLISDQYRFYLRRFWTLYIESQGGQLVSFMSDREMLFQRVVRHAEPLPHNYTLEPSNKLEMIHFRRDKSVKPLYERQLSTEILNQNELQRAKNIEIGIQWDCTDCDLDLYVHGKPNAEVLYFGRNETELGSHWKDFRSSPRLFNAFETISFKEPLDLRHVRIAVNFYSGSAPEGIHGRLRLSASGKTYERPFRLKATSGNKAGGMKASFKKSQASNVHIVMFDAVSILLSGQ